ncbi:MAG TPA: hypothetical protein VLA37_10195, partial [Sphingomonadaceae bacterium]|nr:hypothetical protein [Sphingomonadaceae bacterium]
MFPSSFVITIIALAMGAWVFTTWIRARHGYPLDDGAGGKIERRDDGEVARLREENARLTDQLENYADRLAVLERIVTDKGVMLADEIEALRSRDHKLE